MIPKGRERKVRKEGEELAIEPAGGAQKHWLAARHSASGVRPHVSPPSTTGVVLIVLLVSLAPIRGHWKARTVEMEI